MPSLTLRPCPLKNRSATRFGWCKPHIYLDGGVWICHDDFFIVGKGATAKTAYRDWQTREQSRTRIPRAFTWNMRATLDWYRRGCPRMRSYIGRQQIVSYDINTDELILRG